MSDQTAFFLFLAAIIAASGVWWIASWARDFVDAQVAAALDDFDTAADQAVAIGNGLACGDRLATDLAAVMAPQLIDAAEQILREETA